MSEQSTTISPQYLGEFMAKIAMPLVKDRKASTIVAVQAELAFIRTEAARPQRRPRHAPLPTDLAASPEQIQEITAYLELEVQANQLGGFRCDFTHAEAMLDVYEMQLAELKDGLSRANASEYQPLVAEYQQVYKNYQDFLEELVAAGDGNMETARQRITAWREVRTAADLCYSQLNGSIPGLPDLLARMRSQEEQNSALDQDEDETPSALPMMNIGEEPEGSVSLGNVSPQIRRYLLHGGDSAARFLYHCVLLLRHAIEYGVVDRHSLQKLPDDLRLPFQNWWAEHKAYVPRSPRREERFQSPWIQINLESYHPELIIPPQRCKVKVGHLTLITHVRANQPAVGIMESSDAQLGDELFRLPLHGRRLGYEMVETHRQRVELVPEARSLCISLYDGELLIKEWEISLQTEGIPYPLFDGRDGRLCPSVRHQERLWLLLPKDTTLTGEGYAITRQIEMDENWHTFQILELDLSAVQELYLARHRLFAPRTPGGGARTADSWAGNFCAASADAAGGLWGCGMLPLPGSRAPFVGWPAARPGGEASPKLKEVGGQWASTREILSAPSVYALATDC
jgi:hypothetical protein